MITSQAIYTRYQNLKPILDALRGRVDQTLKSYCQENSFLYDSRIKTLESVGEKVETGRFRSFDDLDDLFACSIIIPNLEREAEATTFIENSFKVVEKRNRSNTQKAPEVFRFDSPRFIVQLLSIPGLSIGETTSVYDLKFEIQLKTAFEYAWQVATHPITYKTDEVNWKRFRLASQLKAIVEQLDILILGFDLVAPEIQSSPHLATENLQSICATIRELVETGEIPQELSPKDLSRFSQNFSSMITSSKKTASLNAALQQIRNYFVNTEAKLIPRSLSLLQICFGVLISEGIISGPFNKYRCPITPELTMAFPAANAVTTRFEY